MTKKRVKGANTTTTWILYTILEESLKGIRNKMLEVHREVTSTTGRYLFVPPLPAVALDEVQEVYLGMGIECGRKMRYLENWLRREDFSSG